MSFNYLSLGKSKYNIGIYLFLKYYIILGTFIYILGSLSLFDEKLSVINDSGFFSLWWYNTRIQYNYAT